MLEMLFALAPWWAGLVLVMCLIWMRSELLYAKYRKLRTEAPSFAQAWEGYEAANRLTQAAALVLVGVTVVMVIMVMMLHGS